MIRRALVAACPLAVLTTFVIAPPVRGASKIAIAAVGDPVAGGGQFAGPPFGEPSAAGHGWIAFRSQLNGSTPEQIVVDNRESPGASSVVASVGQSVDATIGTIKQFLGRPSVNANGDVAFAAEIKPPDDAPKPDPLAPLLPTPGGVFFWSRGKLSVVAAPGLEIPGVGILDLTTPINFFTVESGIDITERTPALNDAGDVAFVASTLNGTTQGGAIVVKRAGQDLTPVVTLNSAYQDGTFQILGPPALNNGGVLAFRGIVEGRTNLDGIFKLEGGALSMLIRDGTIPDAPSASFALDPLIEFGDVVALNDAGDVVCTGGPLFDNSENANLASDGSPGVILIRAGAAPLLAGFPGQRVDIFAENEASVFELILGPEEGSRTAAPGLTPDGDVVFFATVNSGSSQAIFRFDPDTQFVFPLVRLGNVADRAPDGGTYLSASSSPTVDSDGNLAFTARIAGGRTGEALFWRPVTGTTDLISIGDPSPDASKGYFAGLAFSPPLLNDAGDVIFKSYVAKGPTPLGIFRYRADSGVTAVVQVNDPAPLDDAPPFSNLVGDPIINSAGDVAFAATIARRGRGVFVTSGSTLRKVAMPLDELDPPDPRRRGGGIKTVASNPSIDDSGAVAFRGVVTFQSPFFPFEPDERQNCVFLSDASGTRIIAAQDDDSGAGGPFTTFRDPVLRAQRLLFRASILADDGFKEGLFLYDGGVIRPVVVTGQDLGGGTIVDQLQGKALLDDAGSVFLKASVCLNASVCLPDGERGTVIARGTASGVQPLVQTETPGPNGGQIRSLGRLSVSSDGTVALRIGFWPFTGGVPGVFLLRPDTPETFLRLGEGAAAGINGRLVNVNQNVSVNRNEHVAFLASVGGGESRNAIFLAAPTRLRVEQLTVRRTPLSANPNGAPRDRLKLSAVLEPPLLPPPPESPNRKPKDPAFARQKLVAVTVADSVGPLWSGVVQSDGTQLRGRTLRKKGAADTRIGGLRVRFAERSLRITVRSRPFDLTFTAGVTQGRQFDQNGPVLVPPYIVRVDVGEDGGSVALPCPSPGNRRRFRCRG